MTCYNLCGTTWRPQTGIPMCQAPISAEPLEAALNPNTTPAIRQDSTSKEQAMVASSFASDTASCCLQTGEFAQQVCLCGC